MQKFAAALMLLASCATGAGTDRPSDLIVCGGDEVIVLDLRDAAGPKQIWSWKAADHPELPEPLRKKFGSTDDCKPVDGGRKLLISSSGGAIALVERSTGKVLFYASVPNAHSAEILPGNRVVAASSYNDAGNRLLLYDLAVPDQPLATDDLHGAHGAVWDGDRNLLWALGETELRAYQLQQDKLVQKLSRTLPNAGGHDLRSVPGSASLVITTGQHVWAFDRDLLTFRTFPKLGDFEHVKCVDVDPETGLLAYVQGEKSWWAERIKFIGIERTVVFPGKKLYKARWTSHAD